MRIWIPVILTIMTVSTAMPAAAQTYSPDYPFCMRLYTIDGEQIECDFGTLQQCAQSASGRAASCIANPYAKAAAPAPVEQQAPAPAPADKKGEPARRTN
jgi:hypothetical protein